MSSPAEELAQRIRDGFAESLGAGIAAPGAFVADLVEVRHEPPNPNDGVKPGAEAAAGWAMTGPSVARVMADAAFGDVRVTVLGDHEVFVEAFLRGTGPDGVVLDHPLSLRYTLRDGKVVHVLEVSDPAPLAALGAARRAQAPAD